MCLLLHLKIIEYLKNKKHPRCKPIHEFLVDNIGKDMLY